MHELFADRRVRYSTIAVLVVLALFLLVETVGSLKEIRFIGAGVPATNTISVSGEGEVFAVPDIGEFSFSVVEEAETTAAAQNAATEKVNAAIDYLKDNGIEEKDIKTTGFNVFPRYEFREAGASFPRPPEGERVLVGFEVRQKIEVKVREPKEAGNLLSGLAEIGVQNVSNLSFTIDDDEALRDEARQKAIADAKEKAEQLADELGVDLVRVVSFSESGGGHVPFRSFAEDAAQGSAGGVSAPQVPTGENKITSRVSITYEIR